MMKPSLKIFLLATLLLLCGLAGCSASSSPSTSAAASAAGVSTPSADAPQSVTSELMSAVGSTPTVNVTYQSSVPKGGGSQAIQFTFPSGVDFQNSHFWIGTASTDDLSDPTTFNNKDLKETFSILGGLWTGTSYSYNPGPLGTFNLFFAWKINGLIYLTPMMKITVYDATGYPNADSPLGTNLNELNYYDPELVFTDAMKMAMPWISQSGATWDTGVADKIPADANGYPLELPYTVNGQAQTVGTLMLRDIGTHYPAGNYTCLYDGAGTIEFSFAGKIISQTPGKMTVQVTPSPEGIWLKLTQSTKGNNLRNIRFIMPGFENTYNTTQVFHPQFLADTKKYSVLRFMNWERTNGSKNTNWADRTKPTSYTQAGERGVAWEYVFALANTLHADPWINIPHKATNDYIKQLALLAKANLAGDLKTYLEYSNETWNGMFEENNYVMAKGMDPVACPNCDKTNQWTAGSQYTAQASVNVFNIWKQVYGSTDHFVRVLPSQMANPGVSVTIMDFKVNGVSASAQADVLTGAPYFGLTPDPTEAPYWVQQGVPGVLNYLETVAIPQTNQWIKDTVTAATARGLKVVAYEGGQHMVGVYGAENNDALTAVFSAATSDPKMHDLYIKSLAGWKANGGTLYVHFISVCTKSKWGTWGSMEYTGQNPATAPKYKALQEFIDQNQIWW